MLNVTKSLFRSQLDTKTIKIQSPLTIKSLKTEAYNIIFTLEQRKSCAVIVCSRFNVSGFRLLKIEEYLLNNSSYKSSGRKCSVKWPRILDEFWAKVSARIRDSESCFQLSFFELTKILCYQSKRILWYSSVDREESSIVVTERQWLWSTNIPEIE